MVAVSPANSRRCCCCCSQVLQVERREESFNGTLFGEATRGGVPEVPRAADEQDTFQLRSFLFAGLSPAAVVLVVFWFGPVLVLTSSSKCRIDS